MPETLAPFHQQAEDVGTFVIEDRSRDAERVKRDEIPEGPSENTD